MKRQLLILFSSLSFSFLYAQSPANLTSNVTVTRNFSSVTATENTFNSARRAEETQLNIGLNAIANLDLPDQSTWDSFTDGEKMLFLLNDERISRTGINYYGNGPVLGLPFQAIEMGVNGVAQNYAQALLDNDAFSHTYGGTTPSSRITAAIPGSCQEFTTRSENIYAGVSSSDTGFPTAIESAIFNWNYRDASSNWGHREMNLLQDKPLGGATSGGFNNNNGATDKEGFIGVGIARGANYAGFGTNWAYGVVVVLNYFDPVSDALAGNCPYDTGESSNTECTVFRATAGTISNCNDTEGTYDVEVEVNFSANTSTILAIKFSNLSAFQLFPVSEGVNQTQTFLMEDLPADGGQVDITEINLCNAVIDSMPYFDTFMAPNNNCSSDIGTQCRVHKIILGGVSNCNATTGTYDLDVSVIFSSINGGSLGLKASSASATQFFPVEGGDYQTKIFTLTELPANGSSVRVTSGSFCGGTFIFFADNDNTSTAPTIENCAIQSGTECVVHEIVIGGISSCDTITGTYNLDLAVTYSSIGTSSLGLKASNTTNYQYFSVFAGDYQTRVFTLRGLPADGNTITVTNGSICDNISNFPINAENTFIAPLNDNCAVVRGTECRVHSIIAGTISNCNPTTNTYDIEVSVNFSASNVSSLGISAPGGTQYFPIFGGDDQTKTFTLRGLPADGNTVNLTNGSICSSNSLFILFANSNNTFTAPDNSCSNVAGTECKTVSATVGAISNCNATANTYDVEVAVNFSAINASFLSIKLQSASLSTTKSFSVNGGDNQTQTFLLTELPANGETVTVQQLAICGSPHQSIPPFDTYVAPNTCSTPGTIYQVHGFDIDSVHTCNPQTNTYNLDVAVNFSAISTNSIISIKTSNIATAQSFSVGTGDNQTQLFRLIGLPADGGPVGIRQLIIAGGNIANGVAYTGTHFTSPASCGSTCSDGIKNGNETGIDCGGDQCDPCSICQDDYTIIDNPANGIYQASQTLQTDGTITVTDTTIFRAGTSVTLKPGFHAMVGANFSAVIEECEMVVCPSDHTFTAKEVTSTTSNYRSVLSVDLDGDMDMDIISSHDKVTWYENDGEESFTPHDITANIALDLYVEDIDQDGDLDILGAFYANDQVVWFENNGSQVFTEHIITSTADGVRSVSAKDIDQDGDIDLLSASYFDDKIAWYENNGNENFTTHIITTTAAGAYSVEAEDMDGDNDIDIIVGARDGRKITWYENNGSQNFTAHTIAINANNLFAAYPVDMDNDGDMDILATAYRIIWYENNGTQNFVPHIIEDNNISNYWAAYPADIDVDGDVDIFAASYTDDKVLLYENNGKQHFTKHEVDDNADGASAVYAADIDGDQDIDAIVGSIVEDKLIWYDLAFNCAENDTTATSNIPFCQQDNPLTAHILSDEAINPTSVYAIDLDKDGDLDALSASWGDNMIAWYENVGNQNYTIHTIAAATTNVRDVYVDDVDKDGDLDVLSASYTGVIAWYENDGHQNFTAHTISNSDAGSFSVFSIDIDKDGIDVDKDGDIDVLSASSQDDKIAWYENDGNQSFTTHTITTAMDGANSVFAIDVDKDGDIDVLSSARAGKTIAWYENNGTQNFTTHIVSENATTATGVHADDVDADGDIDILASASSLFFFENDGNQSFKTHLVAPILGSLTSVFAADMDNDGDKDILTTGYSSSNSPSVISLYELGCLNNASNSTNPSMTTLSKTTDSATNETVTISETEVKEATSSLSIKIAPNPFKEETTIHYKVPTDTNVELAIYDLQGKRIKMLQRNSYHTAGNYQINLNLSDYTSGIYFVQLQTPTDYKIEKLVLIE